MPTTYPTAITTARANTIRTTIPMGSLLRGNIGRPVPMDKLAPGPFPPLQNRNPPGTPARSISPPQTERGLLAPFADREKPVAYGRQAFGEALIPASRDPTCAASPELEV